MANPRRTRYVAPNIVSPDRFGTRIRDPENNRLLPGEVNAQGQPLGTPQPFATGPDPFAARPPMATGATAVTPRTVAPNPAPRVATPPRDYGVAAATAALTPGAAFKPQPLAYSPPAPVSSASPTAAPAPIPTGAPSTPPRLVTPALPTHPDDMALLRETRARDAAARAPEPISIPGGLTGHAMRPGEDPLHPGQDSREGQALTAAVNRANGVAPTAPAPGTPIPQLLAAAGTNRDVRTPYGIVSSTTLPGGRLDGTGAPEAPARWSDTGVTHPQPLAATAAPPQGIPRPQPAPSLTDPLAGQASASQNYLSGLTAAPSATPAPTVPPRLTRALGIPVATSSAPATAASANVPSNDMPEAISSRPATAFSRMVQPNDPASLPKPAQWVNPLRGLFGGPSGAPDFAPAGVPGGRYGGTGGVKSPLLTAPVPRDFPPEGMPGGRPGGTGSVPLLTGPIPRKKATPLDEPANQYN